MKQDNENYVCSKNIDLHRFCTLSIGKISTKIIGKCSERVADEDKELACKYKSCGKKGIV